MVRQFSPPDSSPAIPARPRATSRRQMIARVLVLLLLHSSSAASLHEPQDASAPSSAAPLHEAAAEDDTELVNKLLAEGSPTDTLDENKMTPLMLASYMGATNAMAALLEAGAALEAWVPGVRMTPLHWAASQGQAEAAVTRGTQAAHSGGAGWEGRRKGRACLVQRPQATESPGTQAAVLLSAHWRQWRAPPMSAHLTETGSACTHTALQA